MGVLQLPLRSTLATALVSVADAALTVATTGGCVLDMQHDYVSTPCWAEGRSVKQEPAEVRQAQV